jgi:hypothetical protein
VLYVTEFVGLLLIYMGYRKNISASPVRSAAHIQQAAPA